MNKNVKNSTDCRESSRSTGRYQSASNCKNRFKENRKLFFSFFVICHGTSSTHIAGLTDAVEEKVREDLNERPFHVEGLNGSQWVVLDYGDVVVHIFDKELRDYYQLEEFWGDAQIIPVESVPNEGQNKTK